jgi:hypothetical protein
MSCSPSISGQTASTGWMRRLTQCNYSRDRGHKEGPTLWDTERPSRRAVPHDPGRDTTKTQVETTWCGLNAKIAEAEARVGLCSTVSLRAFDVLHIVLKRATYEETIEAHEDCFGDQHLATTYCSRLKTRTQCVGEPVQEFATAIEQLAHHTYPHYPKTM